MNVASAPAKLRRLAWSLVPKRPAEQLRSCRERLREFDRIVEQRLDNMVPVRQPLVLITQIQRSGGTLLSQLFDGHPEIHAHPHELKIGYPRKHNWPSIDPGASHEEWFRTLRENQMARSFWGGYERQSHAAKREGWETESFPFLAPPTLQKELFFHCVRESKPRTQRDVLDAHMTSYFNAWLDYQGLYEQPKRWVTAFVPRMGMDPANVDQFFAAYPEGRMISLVRHPMAWFASARRHDPEAYSDLAEAMRLWRQSVEAALQVKAEGRKALLVRFEDLVGAPRETMRAIAAWLGIGWNETLLEPTFNTMPIRADSSFQAEKHGILTSSIDRYRQVLTEQEMSAIEAGSMPVYNALPALDESLSATPE